MSLTLEQVRHVAQLARLSLTPEEEQRYQQQLSAILHAIDELRGLDTEGIEPTSHVHWGEALLRADEVTSPGDVGGGLANAPAKVGTSFAVPKIIE